MKYLSALTFLLELSFFSSAQPTIEWQKSFGGMNMDFAYSVQSAYDGGFTIVGYTRSNDGIVNCAKGGDDIWIIKLDSFGNLEWQRCLGGSSHDRSWTHTTTNEGGTIIAGWTISTDSDVINYHGGSDALVIKLDSLGNIIWSNCYGGSDFDIINSIIPTTDSGYVLAGGSNSSDGDLTLNNGNKDFWIFKIDSAGIVQWLSSFGGSGNEEAHAIIQTSDGGYAVTGFNNSNDGDVTGNHLSAGVVPTTDVWVVKLDSLGSLIWQKSLGGTNSESGATINQTIFGNLIIGGTSHSDDGDITNFIGVSDIWIVNIDINGNIIWEKSFGGTDADYISKIHLQNDEIISVGASGSNDYYVNGNHGSFDFWIFKIDNQGNFLWGECLGGSNADMAFDICKSLGDDFVVVGHSYSDDGDVSLNFGGPDFWTVKLSNLTSIINNENNFNFTLYPNPTTSELNIQFSLPQSKNVKMQLFSSLGQVVKTISTEKLNVGENKINLSIEHLPSGVYHLQLKVDDNMVTRKVVKF